MDWHSLWGSAQTKFSFASGVLTSVSQPSAGGLVKGQSVAFLVGASSTSTCLLRISSFTESDSSFVDYHDAVLKEVAALHVTLGDVAKDGSVSSSISGQVGLLRRLLFDAVDSLAAKPNETAPNPYVQIVRGELPLVVLV